MTSHGLDLVAWIWHRNMLLHPQVMLAASVATQAPFFPVKLLLSLLYLTLSNA